MAQLKNTTVSDTGFLQLPVGTTAQRPTPAAGQMRFNTSTGKAEFYNATAGAWLGTAGVGVVATGGNSVYDVDVEGTTYRVHVFTSTGNSTFTVSAGGNVEYLIVAGGGAGGLVRGGGGGAGGLISGTTAVTPQSYTITVGAGGSGGERSIFSALDNAENSSAFGLVALGGGVGGRRGGSSEPPSDGGSGGGEGGAGGAGQGVGIGLQPTSASSGFGNNGGTGISSGSTYSGGGGGGAGDNGKDGINASGGGGGVGLISFLAGTPVFYSGGGGGHSDTGNPRGEGGLGGGGYSGIGSDSVLGNADSGTANTGGGGGGGGYSTGNISGDGGSGIVIVRYPLRQENPVAASGRAVGDGLVLDLDFAKSTVYSGSGTVVSDSRLNGISGSIEVGPTFTNSRTHRSSFNFRGGTTRDRLQFSHRDVLNLSQNMTAEAWINPSSYPAASGNGGMIVTKITWYFELQNSGVLRTYFLGASPSPGYYSGNTTISLNAWSHVVMVRSVTNSTITTYINGTVDRTVTGISGNTSINASRSLYIGDWVGGSYGFIGQIGIVKMYDRALTQSEIQQNYNATRWRFGV